MFTWAGTSFLLSLFFLSGLDDFNCLEDGVFLLMSVVFPLCVLALLPDFIVGTVHKSKGLEFDTVMVTDDFVKVPCSKHNLRHSPEFSFGMLCFLGCCCCFFLGPFYHEWHEARLVRRMISTWKRECCLTVVVSPPNTQLKFLTMSGTCCTWLSLVPKRLSSSQKTSAASSQWLGYETLTVHLTSYPIAVQFQ